MSQEDKTQEKGNRIALIIGVVLVVLLIIIWISL